MFPEVSWLQNFCTFSQTPEPLERGLISTQYKSRYWLGWLDSNQRANRSSCGSQSPVPFQLGDTPIYKTEPKDFHLWEQWLGLCLQPLPAVFPLYATNISNRFTLLLHTSVLLRDFLFDRNLPDLNREPTQHLWGMLPLTPDFESLLPPIRCCTGSFELVCTLATHFTMALYSLLGVLTC